MTCVPADRRFRLLPDALVGWDVAEASGLQGFDDVRGVRLARIAAGTLTPEVIGRAIPPARLARGCDRCDWYLVTLVPPQSRLLALGACDDCWGPLNASLPLVDAVAIAVDRFGSPSPTGPPIGCGSSPPRMAASSAKPLPRTRSRSRSRPMPSLWWRAPAGCSASTSAASRCRRAGRCRRSAKSIGSPSARTARCGLSCVRVTAASRCGVRPPVRTNSRKQTSRT